MTSRLLAPYAAQMWGQEGEELQQDEEGGGAGVDLMTAQRSHKVVLSACHTFRLPDPGSPGGGSHLRGTLSRRHSEVGAEVTVLN
jgi:hypothetical protein